jgi:putative ABC transport system substrate-binding protein
LAGVAEDDPDMRTWMVAFRQELERSGWSEGQNLRIDYRFAPTGPEQVQASARELVALAPDVILAHTTPVAASLQRESRTVPIVFEAVSDPIGSGFVASLARPGGNLTGILQYEASIVGKWLAMLKEIMPHVARVAIVANPKTTPFDYFLRAAEAAAPSLAIELIPKRVESITDVQLAIQSLALMSGSALLIPPDTTIGLYRDRVIALAEKHRLAAVYPFRFYVAAGGLMSYGIDRPAMFRQAASYVDRILRGEKPGDLPVQTPVKYETVINLKSANAIGLEVPSTLLVRADEVIE